MLAKIFAIYLNLKSTTYSFFCSFHSESLIWVNADNWSIARSIGSYEPFILHFGLFWRGSRRLTYWKRANINRRDEIWFDLLVSQLCFGWYAGLQTNYARTYFPWDWEWGMYFSIPSPNVLIKSNKVLGAIFNDEETSFEFQRDLKHLRAVLMPFAQAIQCMEAKDTNTADVYMYWLAVVAHFHDLIKKDSDKSKYTTEFKEHVCQIENYQFSELIESKHTSNIYLTAFILDPGRHYCFFHMSLPNKKTQYNLMLAVKLP